MDDFVDGQHQPRVSAFSAWLQSLVPVRSIDECSVILLIECGAVEDEYNTILILFDYPSYGTR